MSCVNNLRHRIVELQSPKTHTLRRVCLVVQGETSGTLAETNQSNVSKNVPCASHEILLNVCYLSNLQTTAKATRCVISTLRSGKDKTTDSRTRSCQVLGENEMDRQAEHKGSPGQ